MKNNFSERLAEVMHTNGVTVGGLANDLRTHPSTVSRWLNGSVPRGRMLEDLSKALDTTVRWLRDGEGPGVIHADESIAPAPRLQVLHEGDSLYASMDDDDLIQGCQDCTKRLMGEKNKIVKMSILGTLDQMIQELRYRNEKSLTTKKTVNYRD